MIRSRDEHIGKIKDIAECRSRGSRDRSHVIGVPEFEGVVQWRGVGWTIVWLRSHVTRVRSLERSKSFGYLTTK
jgi:hypothetical protein